MPLISLNKGEQKIIIEAFSMNVIHQFVITKRVNNKGAFKYYKSFPRFIPSDL